MVHVRFARDQGLKGGAGVETLRSLLVAQSQEATVSERPELGLLRLDHQAEKVAMWVSGSALLWNKEIMLCFHHLFFTFLLSCDLNPLLLFYLGFVHILVKYFWIFFFFFGRN